MPSPEQSPAFHLGQQHADLFLGFSCFLFDNCQQRHLGDLFFCTREGVFFKAVFDALFCRPEEATTVNTHLLEASRLSVFPATVLVDDQLDLSGLFRLYKQQSPLTILKSLGLNPDDYMDLLSRYDLNPHQLENEAVTQNLLSAFLQDDLFIERAYPNLKHHRRAALAYLSQCFADLKHIAFVDIGWRGTIQNSIATLLPDRHFRGLYMGLALERNLMQPNCEKWAYGPNQNISNRDTDLLHAVNVLEFTCLSNGGSASNYQQTASGEFVASMRSDPAENARIEAFSLPFQQGVLSSAKSADIGVTMGLHRSGELRYKALSQWRSLIQNPAQSLVDAYFGLISNEVFGLGTMKDQSAVPRLRNIALAMFSKEQRRDLVRFLTYSQWTHGHLRRKDLPRGSKWVVYLLMRMAEMFKHYTLKTRQKPNS